MATLVVHLDTLSLITLLFGLIFFALTWVVSLKRLHQPLRVATAVLATLSLILNYSRCDFNDDTVFYLLEGFQSLGTGSGQLPMRVLPFGLLAKAFTLPSSIFLAAQAVLCVLAAVFVATVFLATRRLGSSVAWAFWASSIAVLWGVSWSEFVKLRPDTFATAFSLGGVLCLLPSAPERKDLTRAQVVASFALLTLAASIGPRHWLYPVSGLVCLALFFRNQLARYAKWAMMGILAGLLPTALYITLFDGWVNVIQVSFLQSPVSRSTNFSLTQLFPFTLVFLALLSQLVCKPSLGTRILVTMWLTAALNVLLLSRYLPAAYPLLTWVALSSVLIARMLDELSCCRNYPMLSRLLVLSFALLVIPTLKAIPSPEKLKQQWTERDIAFALVDWLHHLSKQGCIVAVCPCLPVNGEVCWGQFNAHSYAYWAKSGDYPMGEGGVFSFLKQRPSVIQWDPWPRSSRANNIVEWALQREFLKPDQVDDLLSSLRRDYRLYHFPMPGSLQLFGGGGFLVRRDIDATLSGRVKLTEYKI